MIVVPIEPHMTRDEMLAIRPGDYLCLKKGKTFFQNLYIIKNPKSNRYIKIAKVQKVIVDPNPNVSLLMSKNRLYVEPV